MSGLKKMKQNIVILAAILVLTQISTLAQSYKIDGDTVLHKPNPHTLQIGSPNIKVWDFGKSGGWIGRKGVLYNVSDDGTKEDIEQCNAVLDSLMKLKISEWNYIGEEERHIGIESAGEFHSLFEIGYDSAISHISGIGVALASIKELNTKLNGYWGNNADKLFTEMSLVGIGLTDPQEKLHIDGAIIIGNNTNPDPLAGTIRWNQGATDFEGYVGDEWKSLTGLGGNSLWNQQGNNLYYNLGNIGIGTSNPTNKLDVVGGDINIDEAHAYKIGGDDVVRIDGFSTYIGKNAGVNSTGGFNTILGNSAGRDNTTGSDNVFLGRYAGHQNTMGDANMFLGYAAGYSNTMGDANMFLGYAAGTDNTTGGFNIFIGGLSGELNTTGTENVFIGHGTGGNNEIGSQNTLIGDHASTTIHNLTNATAIGYNASVSSSHSLILGNQDVSVGIGVTDPGNYKLYVAGDAFTTGNWQGSDARYKQNIRSVQQAATKIKALRGTSYEFRQNEFKEKNFRAGNQYGFIAQELQEVLPELVRQDEDGFYAVNYIGVIPILVEAFKEQQDVIEEQKSINEAQNDLIANLQKELTVLKSGKNSEGNNQQKISDASELMTPSGMALEIEAQLFQNKPNPFRDATSIRYFLPNHVAQAQLYVYNMNGMQLSAHDIDTWGEGEIVINAGELVAGMYLYSLIADGREVATKRMILTK